jgi:hypothetical protein
MLLADELVESAWAHPDWQWRRDVGGVGETAAATPPRVVRHVEQVLGLHLATILSRSTPHVSRRDCRQCRPRLRVVPSKPECHRRPTRLEDEMTEQSQHSHEHTHADVSHTHEHGGHDHQHVEHTHQHAHGSETHEHEHVHDMAAEQTHEHRH